MSRLSTLRAALTSEPLGWHAGLFRKWVLYNAIAFTIILGTVYLLAGLGLDVTKQAAGHIVASLLIAFAGALLYGVVLGSLQWRVLRERISISRRRWITTCVGPGLLAWVLMVVPTAIDTATSDGSVQVAYLLAVSQALALGPLIGLSQAFALRPYTTRWAWWIVANVASWLLVDIVIYLLSLVFSGLDFLRGDGSTIEVYVMLLLTTPLTGRWVLLVTAPPALKPPPTQRTPEALCAPDAASRCPDNPADRRFLASKGLALWTKSDSPRSGRQARSLDNPCVVARDESGPRFKPATSWYHFGTD